MHRSGKHVTAMFVVAKHIEACARRGQENCFARFGQRRRFFDGFLERLATLERDAARDERPLDERRVAAYEQDAV